MAPSANAEVVKLAEPPDSGALPSSVLPSRNVTVPVGTIPGTVATVAVKVTVCPSTTALLDAAKVVFVAAGAASLMTCAKAADALPAKVASPL